MRPRHEVLLAALLMAAPMPAAAQVSVDLNALDALGPAGLPAPPPAAPAQLHPTRRIYRHLARAGHAPHHTPETAVASAAPQAQAGPETIQHPKNLGPSFTSLPALPAAPPLLPHPAVPAPAKMAKAAPPTEAPPAPPAPPQLALPQSAPPLPSPASPTRLAEATPAPPAAALPPPTPKAAPSAPLPEGADRLTLPFFVQQSDLPPAETAMLRDFAQRYGPQAQYIIRAYASAPAGDDDPSTPRRISLARAQSVAAVLAASGAQPEHLRVLALGNTGGATADRVEVIAMPPASGHTASDSTP